MSRARIQRFLVLALLFVAGAGFAAGEENIPGYKHYRNYLGTAIACEYGNYPFRTSFDFCDKVAGLLMPLEEPAAAIAGDWKKWNERPPRVCFIANTGAAERDIWELGRWMEMDYWIVPYNFFSQPPDEDTRKCIGNRFSPEWKTETFWADFERERSEVLVLASASLDLLPASLQNRIADWVKAGGALVVLNSPGNGGALKDILPLRSVVAGEKDKQPQYAAANVKTFTFKPAHFQPVGKHPLIDGLPLDSCPPILPWYHVLEKEGDVLLTYGETPLLAIRTAGKGRVVSFLSGYPWLAHMGEGVVPSANPYDHVRFEGYRYYRVWLELASRLILWAADRESSSRFVAEATANEKTGRSAVALNVISSASTNGEALRCRVEAYDSTGHRLLLPETTLSAEAGKTGRVLVELPGDLVTPAGKANTGDLSKIKKEEDAPPGPCPGIPADNLMPGMVSIQVFAESLQRHQRYWSGITLRMPVSVTVEKLGVDRKSYKRGDAIQATASVSNALGTSVVATACWSLADSYGREVCRKESATILKPGESKSMATSLAVPAGRLLATYNTLSLSFRNGRQLLGGGSCEVWTPPDLTAHNQTKDWRTTWATAVPTHLYASYARDFLGPLGSRSITTGGTEEPVGYLEARYGIEWGQENLMILGDRWNIYTNHIRSQCYSDPAVMKELVERVRGHLRLRAPYGPFALQTGEEAALSNPNGQGEVCICPRCTAALQAFLRERYGSVEKLNAAWDSRFTSFDEAKPVLREEAMQRGNPAPWLDFRESMARIYNNCFRLFSNLCREDIPGLPTGVNATTAGAASGYDYDLLGKTIQSSIEYDSYWPYTSPGQWKIQLLASHGVEALIYHGYTYQTDPGVHGAYAWQILMNGGNGIALFTIAGGQLWFAQSHGLLVPNGRTRAIQETERDIVNGHGMLVMNTQRIRQAALYYSQRDQNLAEFLGKPDLKKDLMFLDPTSAAAVSGNSLGMFRRILLDMGYSMNCTFADELKSGRLDNDLPILVLPDALALGSGEIEALQRFVKKGGVLLADLRAGLYSGDGKPAFDRTDLAPLFGFIRTKPQVETAQKEIRLIAQPEKPIKVSGKGWIKAEGATVLATFADKTPAILEKKVGKGRALFFNCILQDSPDAGIVRGASSGTGVETSLDRALIDFIAQRLREHVRPDADLAAPGAEPSGVYEGQETVCFAGGEARYLYTRNVFDTRPDAPLSIVFQQSWHVYDMGNGRYLGHVNRVEAPTDRWVKMLALLPYTVDGLRATVGQPRYAPGDAAQINAELITSNRCGDHVFRVKVSAPDGRAMTEYPPRILAPKGKAAIDLSLALNAAPGCYRIEIEDVATGAATTASFWVK